MALYMVMVADEDDMDRFVMPLSEDRVYMEGIARETGTRVFRFRDREQYNRLLTELGFYHEKMNTAAPGTFFFSSLNPVLETGKPAGMTMADYVYGNVVQYALENGVDIVYP